MLFVNVLKKKSINQKNGETSWGQCYSVGWKPDGGSYHMMKSAGRRRIPTEAKKYFALKNLT